MSKPLLHYKLSNGDILSLPARLQNDDEVTIAQAGWLGMQSPRAARVVDAKALEPASPADAFSVVSSLMCTPATRSVHLREDGSMWVAVDAGAYADLKDRLGHGPTAMPLEANEHFRHGRFTFTVAGSHAWQRAIDPQSRPN